MSRSTLMLRWVVAAVALSTATANAEDLLEKPRDRQGYYLALGLRSTVLYSQEDGDGLGPWNGFTTRIALGQLFTERFGAGLTIDFGGASGDGQTASMFGLGMAGQAELFENFAAHASVGFGVVSLDDPDEDEGTRGAVGAMYTLGISYDWFPWSGGTGGFSLTPSLELRAVPSNDVDAYIALIGLNFSYWTGLPRNQLELPPDKAFR